jgi:hypothetical protein
VSTEAQKASFAGRHGPDLHILTGFPILRFLPESGTSSVPIRAPDMKKE